MPYCVEDTITALATAPGGALRGVIRLSGPDTITCLRLCFQSSHVPDLSSITRATVVPGSLVLAEHRHRLPCDLYLWPTRRSYTRQISAELHTIGSPPLLDAAIEVLCQGGARLAEPGEFTLRAFLAGRLDLTQAEAVLGVVDAENSKSLDVALAQLAGGLTGPLKELRSDLLDLLADLEAGLDFADEDIEFVQRDHASERLQAAQHAVTYVLGQILSRGTATQLPRVVLRGWPNVGKSSLINALCDGPVAIVSELAGTTRDYVSRQFQWDGVEGILIDTAGVDTAGVDTGGVDTGGVDTGGIDTGGVDTVQRDGTIRAAAQRLAEEQHHRANLELLCLDSSRSLHPDERSLLAESPGDRLVVWTKTDRGLTSQPEAEAAILTSSRTGSGIEQLRTRICQHLAAAGGPAISVVASTAQRCRASLEAAVQHLDHAGQLLNQDLGHELVVMDLREALEHVGQVVGAVYTDDILDRVFQRFCIGK